MHGRDGVRVCPSALLEELVGAAVRQHSAWSGEAMKLVVQLLGGEQRCSRVLGVGIGRHQRQRGEVVAGDPGGAGRAEYLGPILQPQHESVTLHEGDPQDGALRELAAARRHSEHRLK